MAIFDSERDTTREAAREHVRALRAMGPAGRLAAGLRFSRSMIARSRAALRARNPGADDTRLKLLWIEQCYGRELAQAVEQQIARAECTSPTTSS